MSQSQAAGPVAAGGVPVPASAAQRSAAPPSQRPAAGKAPSASQLANTAPRKKNRKRKEVYATFVHRVLKQTHHDMTISNHAMAVIESFLNDIFDRIAREAAHLAKINKHSTLTSREIQTATRLVLTGELSNHAITEGQNALGKFCNATPKRQ